MLMIIFFMANITYDNGSKSSWPYQENCSPFSKLYGDTKFVAFGAS